MEVLMILVPAVLLALGFGIQTAAIGFIVALVLAGIARS